MKIKFFLIIIFIIFPFKLQALENPKQIRVFDFFGNLESVINLQDYNWLKTGDIKIADLGSDNIPEIILSAPLAKNLT